MLPNAVAEDVSKLHGQVQMQVPAVIYVWPWGAFVPHKVLFYFLPI